MDSLTQMALGAACGEIVLGKKAGNRAMLWGAIGGTIPDLDIIGNLFMDEVGALAFHRGISHSLLFAVLAPFAFGWLVHRLYDSGYYKTKTWKGIVTGLNVFFWLLVLLVTWFITKTAGGGTPSYGALAVVGGGAALFIYWLIKHYLLGTSSEVNATRKDWTWLFFWAIFTHPLLDCCTAYGTQIFQPFWDYRVAFNNISVADPLYTFWFLIFLTGAGFLTRRSPRRRMLTWFAILFSSGYLAFTAYHKLRMDSIFENTLRAEKISYTRYMTAPTILNNVLWTGTAETDSAYYQGLYSFWDTEEKVKDLKRYPKNHHLLEAYDGSRETRILKWFSNNYYNIQQLGGDTLKFNDLRYGTISTGEGDFVFFFHLCENEEGVLEVTQPRERDIEEGALEEFWKRIKGI